MKLSDIVPVFNEEANLTALYHRILEVSQHWGLGFELAMVDDGSRDHSLDILKSLHDADKRLRFVSFSRNFGHQVAVSAGIEHAQGDAAVIIDADLQDPPEVIGRFLEKWREGARSSMGTAAAARRVW